MTAERRRVLVAIGFFVSAWLTARAIFEIDVRFSDVPLFRRYGEEMAAGDVPYRDFALEYPPAALPFFVLPALASSFVFKLNVTNFSDFTANYGAIGGAIVTMLWFYVSSTAILIGAELNGVIEKASRPPS